MSSAASGRLELLTIDEPPLLVGKLIIDHLELRSGEAIELLPQSDAWPFLARQLADGSVDALWLPQDMPVEANALLRFLVGETQGWRTQGSVAFAFEETPTGVLAANYRRFSILGMRLVVRVRSDQGLGPDRVAALGVFVIDAEEIIALFSAQASRADLVGSNYVDSGHGLILARIGPSTTTMSDKQIAATIEALSKARPMAILQPLRTDAERQESRRAEESWSSILARLRVIDEVDPTLISRAAAHLVADDSRVRELEVLVDEASTTPARMTSIHAAFGECGTPACQAALLAGIREGVALPQSVLTGIARIQAPLTTTVDAALALAREGGEAERSIAGIAISRFAALDPEGARRRVNDILAGVEGCTSELDAWFGFLGNAGQAGATPVLLGCLDPNVDEERRASAASALRRIPGDQVSNALVGVVATDASEKVRLHGLRALEARDLSDADLEPLVGASKTAWSRPSLDLLLDIVGKLPDPGCATEALLGQLGGSEDDEIAERARQAQQPLQPE